MPAVLSAFAKAFAQLGDRAIVWVLVKSALATLAVFIALGAALYAALVWAMAQWFGATSGMAEAAMAAIVAAIAFWLLFRVVALAVLQLFADEIVVAVEAKHYPVLAQSACALPLRDDLANSLRGMMRAIGVNALALPLAIALLITGVGAALVFLAVNAWLLGRELTDMAWLRHCGQNPKGNPVPRHQRVLLGASVAAMMLVPFANLLAPIVGAAAGTHLTHSAMRRMEASG